MSSWLVLGAPGVAVIGVVGRVIIVIAAVRIRIKSTSKPCAESAQVLNLPLASRAEALADGIAHLAPEWRSWNGLSAFPPPNAAGAPMEMHLKPKWSRIPNIAMV